MKFYYHYIFFVDKSIIQILSGACSAYQRYRNSSTKTGETNPAKDASEWHSNVLRFFNAIPKTFADIGQEMDLQCCKVLVIKQILNSDNPCYLYDLPNLLFFI